MSIENKKKRIRQKIDEAFIIEKGPISTEGALKFVFEIPEDGGPVTCEFEDGSEAVVDVETDSEAAGNFAFVGKSSTAEDSQIFEVWESKPSKEEAQDVLARVKSPQHGNV